MGFYGYLIGAAGLIGLAVGLCLALRSRRTLRRLDSMLTAAIDGGFSEDTFDESALSAVETKMSRFLSGCAAANRDLSTEKESIKSLIADISHQTKTPIANILLYASLLSEGDLSPAQQACVEDMLRAWGSCRYVMCGGFEGAERRICAFLPDWQEEEDWLAGAGETLCALAGRALARRADPEALRESVRRLRELEGRNTAAAAGLLGKEVVGNG